MYLNPVFFPGLCRNIVYTPFFAFARDILKTNQQDLERQRVVWGHIKWKNDLSQSQDARVSWLGWRSVVLSWDGSVCWWGIQEVRTQVSYQLCGCVFGGGHLKVIVHVMEVIVVSEEDHSKERGTGEWGQRGWRAQQTCMTWVMTELCRRLAEWLGQVDFIFKGSVSFFMEQWFSKYNPGMAGNHWDSFRELAVRTVFTVIPLRCFCLFTLSLMRVQWRFPEATRCVMMLWLCAVCSVF